MKFRTIVLGVSGAVFLVGISITGASFYVASAFQNASDQSRVLMSSMRYQMTADMYHDSMRGIVYRAMYAATAGDAAMASQANGEVAQYAQSFRDAIVAQGPLALPDEIRAALGTVAAPLDNYISSAQSIVGTAAKDGADAAKSQLPDFETAFSTLATAMAKISDAIEAANVKAAKGAENIADLANIADWSGIGITMALVAAMLALSQQFVTRPLVAMTRTMQRLADGDTEAKAEQRQPVAEIGAMAATLGVFREALVSRAKMSKEAEANTSMTASKAAETAALNKSLARTVEAAVAGNFGQLVDTGFKDAELNALASGVNDLVATVDRGLGETGAVLASLAKANLSKRMVGNYRGAFAQLKTDTNAVAEKLTEIMGGLRQTSRALKTATGEILSGANDLSERTTKQAATIEETSAAMEQLATTVIDNAKRAEAASVKARSVSQSAAEGGQVMARATEAMERITTSSSKISNIIGMIDDIAFQTNLLALNASVEAARAGEAGKGFAVVAIEVRRLAQSAAQASSEVKMLIEQSASEVSGGSRLVADASAKLVAMLDAVQENASLIDAIASASREQASSIEEVSTAVRLMDEMTQHNAALVEETNAAIEQTEAQASELDKVVDVFIFDETRPGLVSNRRAA
jgi:methyl-accepting chemotaxis protein